MANSWRMETMDIKNSFLYCDRSSRQSIVRIGLSSKSTRVRRGVMFYEFFSVATVIYVWFVRTCSETETFLKINSRMLCSHQTRNLWIKKLFSKYSIKLLLPTSEFDLNKLKYGERFDCSESQSSAWNQTKTIYPVTKKLCRHFSRKRHDPTGKTIERKYRIEKNNDFL